MFGRPDIAADGQYETKRCPKCKETKSVQEFYKNTARSDNLSSLCKKCEHAHTKTKRETINTNYSITVKKTRVCLKHACPDAHKYSCVDLICPVCKTHFKRRLSDYNHRVSEGAQTQCCSRKCAGIVRSKMWREKSPYAKKIKELTKTYGGK